MLVGIVGKPNVGKSTFFRALTMADAESANYPFTTIDPNKGVGFVRVEGVGKEFNVQCNPRVGFSKNGIRFVPVEIIDVAGLVPGAHEGKGLGNKFLDDLRNADVLIHVIDISGSTNEKGEPVTLGSYNPIHDIEFLNIEIDLWFYQVLTKNWNKISKTQASKKQKTVDALRDIVAGLSVKERHLLKALNNMPELMIDWKEKDIKEFASRLRKESKPMVIVANKIDLPGAENNLKKLKERFPELFIIPVSSESEFALKEATKKGLIEYTQGDKEFNILKEDLLNDKQKKALDYIKINVLKKFGSTGVQEAIDIAIFKLLKYIAIFPGGVKKLSDKHGNVLPDCFLLPENSTALDFADTIHSDLAKNFIKAVDVRTKQLLGKTHILKHRDIIEIVANK